MKIFLIIFEAAIIVFLLVRLIFAKSKMNTFIKQAEQIKKRNLNLDDIEFDDRDSSEIVLADAINAIKNNMQTFLESTKSNVVILSDAIETLSQGARTNQEGSHRISGSLSMVVEKVDEQLEIVKSCLSLIEENTLRLQEIDGSVKEISNLLGESVDSCKSGVNSMENYEANMSTIAEDLAKSEEILKDFSEKIGEINEIGSFIISISNSLKMLALNASIEAARVGNAGSGFAVVAKEMGVMSEKTQEGIDTINEILTNVVESSERVNHCIHDSVEVFEKSRNEFDAVSGSFRVIDRQSVNINDKMQQIFSMIEGIANNSSVTKERAEQAYVTSEEITAGTQEISSISEETSESSQKIIENVEALNNMLGGLETLLRQFNTSVEPTNIKPKKTVKIGVFCIVDNDFWRSVRRGAIYAKKELEAIGAVIQYVPFFEWGTVYEIMNAKIDEMLAEDYDGFILPGFMLGSVQEKLQKALSMGKLVYTFNCDISEKENRTAVFQPDVAEAAVLAAKALERELGGKGRILVLEGGRDVPVNAVRSDNFQKYFEGNKSCEVVDVLHIDYLEEETYQEVLTYLKEHDNIDGIFITTGTPVAAARAIEDLKRKIKMVVFDHSQAIFKYIKKGIIVAAIGQDPFGQGYDPIVWMYNSVVTGKELPSDNMKCRSNIVDRNNVDSLVEA